MLTQINWDDGYRFGLGNEFNNRATHIWLGTYHLVAVTVSPEFNYGPETEDFLSYAIVTAQAN